MFTKIKSFVGFLICSTAYADSWDSTAYGRTYRQDPAAYRAYKARYGKPTASVTLARAVMRAGGGGTRAAGNVNRGGGGGAAT